MEYDRKEAPCRPELERIGDWDEFYIGLPEGERIDQAARCMDCGTPFCHSGMILNGVPSGCPLNNLIPEWNDLIYKGLWKDALERLLKTNNFPEFTARVCPAPCEGACTLGVISPQITIRNNELDIIEKGFQNGWVKPFIPVKRTGRKVAVVGSGPSGLACADQLNKYGHSVTLIERSEKPGGLLMYGIPGMKLGKKIVDRRISLMEESGIGFQNGVEIGVDMTGGELLDGYDAVVLCCGSTAPRDLKVKGRELEGIHFAVEYLSGSTRCLISGDETKPGITAKGKDVVIIGGGDTGNDCVATAIRQGCKSVMQFEIMPEAPLERRADNPWPEFPKIRKTDYGQKECIALFGKDPREYSISTLSFEGDENNNVAGLNTVKVEWIRDRENRFIPVTMNGTEEYHKAQLVLLAMGFTGVESRILDEFNLDMDDLAKACVENSHATKMKKLFIAGDMRIGQSLVVRAIKEGRSAAAECDGFLMG